MRLLTERRTWNGLRRLARGRRGANLVEFAMAMAILIPLMFGIIEFSLVFFTYHEVTDAARVAARWAAVRGSASCTNTPGLATCDAQITDIQSYVQNQGYPGLTPSSIVVTPTWSQATVTTTATVPTTTWSSCGSGVVCNAPGNQVVVQVAYAYPIMVPYWKAVTINISSTAAMVVSQ